MLSTVEDTPVYEPRHARPQPTHIVRTAYFNGRRWIAGVEITPTTITHASGLFWAGSTYSRSTRQR